MPVSSGKIRVEISNASSLQPFLIKPVRKNVKFVADLCKGKEKKETRKHSFEMLRHRADMEEGRTWMLMKQQNEGFEADT